MTMPAFRDLLGKFVNSSVIDRTGLTATYRVAMDIPMEDVMQDGRGACGQPRGRPGDVELDSGSNAAIFAGVQLLGLKLEQRKANVEILVADHADRVPAEN